METLLRVILADGAAAVLSASRGQVIHYFVLLRFASFRGGDQPRSLCCLKFPPSQGSGLVDANSSSLTWPCTAFVDLVILSDRRPYRHTDAISACLMSDNPMEYISILGELISMSCLWTPSDASEKKKSLDHIE